MGHKLSIELFFFDAGGGHRSAATSIHQVITKNYPDWTVTLINLQDLLQNVDPVHRISRFQSQDIYNGILKRGWTYGSRAMLRGLQQGIRLMVPLLETRLRDYWQYRQPDLVVSLIPNFNGVMFRALHAVNPRIPYVTVMTDLADCPPHFWQEPQDQYMICGTDMAMQQARRLGYQTEKLFRVSGMALNPKFYQPSDNILTRDSLGLDPQILTALIMFGGYSSNKAEDILKKFDKSDVAFQAIVLCGHNEKLRNRLDAYPNCHAVGFTKEVPAYMRLADFFIGKPGPGSLCEALHMGLPVIVERNQRTLLQERYNTLWIEEQKLGVVVKSLNDIVNAVEHLTQKTEWELCRQNIARLNNRAVFEIPHIFEEILQQTTLETDTRFELSQIG